MCSLGKMVGQGDCEDWFEWVNICIIWVDLENKINEFGDDFFENE